MPDLTRARLNMVSSQVRPNDVTDVRIVEAMGALPREKFVGAAPRDLAYADTRLRVADGRTLLDPRGLAKLMQLAEIRSTDVVLIVGCATGYTAALAARLASTVVALEEDADLARAASQTLAQLAIDNAVVVEGRLAEGLADQAPFDVIAVDGAVGAAPDRLLDQLAPGGRLVTVMKDRGVGRAHVFVREGRGFSSRAAFDVEADVLPGFEPVVGFVFQ